MKKITSSIIFFFFVSNCYSQGGNLQFNRVLNFTSGANYVVPPNKVLKIESVNLSLQVSTTLNYFRCDTVQQGNQYQTYCLYSYPNNVAFFLQLGTIKLYPVDLFNGYPYSYNSNYSEFTCYSCQPTRQFNISTSGTTISVPHWLSEGDSVSIVPYLSQISIFPTNFGIHISAIEFNIVP
jgi:hypothetical protein